MKKPSLFCIFVTVVTWLAFSTHAASAPKAQIWLPISYQQHYQRLVEASEKVRSMGDCYDLLSGTLSERQSSADRLVFRFRCRTKEREIFTVTVNEKDLSYMTNSLAVKRERVASNTAREESRRRHEETVIQEAEEMQRQQDLRNILAERSQYWGICKRGFEDDTEFFDELKVVSPQPPIPDVSVDGVFTYIIEFQSLSWKMTVSSYVATATIDSLDKCNMEIRSL
ncbi:MAG: hypothetical protein ACI9D5_001423 [Candidatus Endobugula sp.]